MSITQFLNTNLNGTSQGPSGESTNPVFGEVVGAIHGATSPASGGLQPIPTDAPGSLRINKPQSLPTAHRAIVSIVDRNTSAAVSQLVKLDASGAATIPDTAPALAAAPALIPLTIRVDYLNVTRHESSTGVLLGMGLVTSTQKALGDSKDINKKKPINVSLLADAGSSGELGVMLRAILSVSCTVKLWLINKQMSTNFSLEIKSMASRQAQIVISGGPWWMPKSVLKPAQDILDTLSLGIKSDYAITHWSYTVGRKAPAGTVAVTGGWVSSQATTTKTSMGNLGAEVDLIIDTA